MFHKEDLGHERGVDANAFLPIINNNFPLKVNPQTFGVRQTDGEHIKYRIIYPTTSPSPHKVGKNVSWEGPHLKIFFLHAQKLPLELMFLMNVFHEICPKSKSNHPA